MLVRTPRGESRGLLPARPTSNVFRAPGHDRLDAIAGMRGVHNNSDLNDDGTAEFSFE